MKTFKVKTPQNELNIQVYSKFINKRDVKVDKILFNEMCRKGCINYGKKYSCPPFVPDFETLVKNSQGLFVVLFLCKLNQIDSTEYNKIRIANVIMKSRIEKLMRELEEKFDTIYLSTGSCRLCKPCNLKKKLPCKYPEKRRNSLEATGIDCDDLAKKLFNIPLLWYRDKKAPKYSCVICGLVCNKKDVKEIEKEINPL